METAEHFIPGATSGNATSIAIAAPPDRVWKAMHELTFADLKVTRVLSVVRSLPSLVRNRGSLLGPGDQVKGVLDGLQASRFRELHSEPGHLLTLGVVGQFWKLDGGQDAEIESAPDFVAFEEPGFIKSTIDFELHPTATGTRLTTHTFNRATDSAADRKFRRYWLLIGPFSKAIRVDMLHGIRRRAQAG